MISTVRCCNKYDQKNRFFLFYDIFFLFCFMILFFLFFSFQTFRCGNKYDQKSRIQITDSDMEAFCEQVVDKSKYIIFYSSKQFFLSFSVDTSKNNQYLTAWSPYFAQSNMRYLSMIFRSLSICILV